MGRIRRAAVLGLVVLLGVAGAGTPEGRALYDQGRYDLALDELRAAAEQGDPAAATLVGTMYLGGLGTQKDPALAAYWLQQSARQGDAVSQRTLAEMYLAGTGLPQDDFSSAYNAQEAAAQGDAPAQVLLGKLYLDGRGVEQSVKSAFESFLAAAHQGSAEGEYQLAQLYERGEGTPPDRNRAIQSYTAAAAAGHQGAADALQRLTGTAAAPAPAISPPVTTVPSSAPETVPAATTRPRRVALVIANQTYRDATLGLTGPVNDARLIQASLLRAGFTVTVRSNLDLAQMNREISSFLAGIDRTTVSVLYYSGHGIEIGGTNYLIPTDFTSPTTTTSAVAVAQSVDIAGLYARMPAQAEGSLNITILDACRNNPFKGRGLKGISETTGLKAVGVPAGDGDGTIETFTAYAAASGQVAQDGAVNGPYATALARQMTVPGQVLEVMFRNVRLEVARMTGNQQIPTSYSNISSEFVFVPMK